MSWVTYSFLGMLAFAAMQLVLKRLTQLEPKIEVINFYFFLFSTAGFLLLSAMRGTKLVPSAESVPWFAAAGAIAVLANFWVISALRSAPNPGYVSGIRAFEMVIIAGATVFLYGSELTPTRIAGIALAATGVILLSM